MYVRCYSMWLIKFTLLCACAVSIHDMYVFMYVCMYVCIVLYIRTVFLEGQRAPQR